MQRKRTAFLTAWHSTQARSGLIAGLQQTTGSGREVMVKVMKEAIHVQTTAGTSRVPLNVFKRRLFKGLDSAWRGGAVLKLL